MMGKTDWLAKAMHHYDQSRGATSYEATDFNMKAAHLCIAMHNAERESGSMLSDRVLGEIKALQKMKNACGKPQPFDCEEAFEEVWNTYYSTAGNKRQDAIAALCAYVRSLGYEVKE